MADWEVVPALNNLLAEINRIAPSRDKASDGSIGDQSHASGPSGHNPDESGVPEDEDPDGRNEVRARDFDKDLRRAGLSMEMITKHLLRRCRAGRTTWIKYMIYDRRIWRARTGWRQETYSGSNPHDKHLHVSCKPDTASENDTKPLGLEELVDVAPTVEEFVNGLVNHRVNINPGGTPNMQPLGGVWAYLDSRAIRSDNLVKAATSKLDVLTGKVEAMAARLAALDVREAAEVPASAEVIAQAVVEMIEDTPEIIVNVSPEALQAAIVGAIHEISTPPEGGTS